MGLKLADLKQKELDGCRLCPASHLNKRLACIGLHSYVNIYIYIHVHIHMYIYIECVCIYMTMHVYIYIYTTMYCIYICTSIYIYIYSTKSNERGWLYRYVCWQLSFLWLSSCGMCRRWMLFVPCITSQQAACLHWVYIYIYTYDYACFRRRRGGILVAKAATKSRSS